MRFLLAFLLSFAAHFLWIANGSFSFAAEAPPRVLEVQIQAPKPLPKETKSVLSAQPKTADKNKVEHAEKSDNSNALTAISTTQNELLASVDLAENPSANELADVITKAEAQASNLSDNLPTHGSIFYRVDYGPDENRTEVGRAENRFLVEGQNYKLISIMETVGSPVIPVNRTDSIPWLFKSILKARKEVVCDTCLPLITIAFFPSVFILGEASNRAPIPM